MAGRGRTCVGCGGFKRKRLASFPVNVCAVCHKGICHKHTAFVDGHGHLCPKHLKELPEDEQRAALKAAI